MNATSVDVEAVYHEAVEASCLRYGNTDEVNPENVYYTTYGRFPKSGSKTDQFYVIMMQKWIALANGQGLEAFFEHNRTDIPKESAISRQDEEWVEEEYEPGEFTVSIQGVLSEPEKYPKRLLFSATERSKNPNIPATVERNVPVWWEVDSPSVE